VSGPHEQPSCGACSTHSWEVTYIALRSLSAAGSTVLSIYARAPRDADAVTRVRARTWCDRLEHPCGTRARRL